MPTPAERVAFDRLRAFAKKVAHELADASVPHDSYVSRPSYVAFKSGFFGEKELLVPAAHTTIGGWRIHQQSIRVTRIETLTRLGDTRTTSQSREFWLMPDGRLIDAWLEDDAIAPHPLRKMTSNVKATELRTQPLTLDVALSLDNFPRWRTETRRGPGWKSTEEFCVFVPAKSAPPPCSRLSSWLSSVRKQHVPPGNSR